MTVGSRGTSEEPGVLIAPDRFAEGAPLTSSKGPEMTELPEELAAATGTDPAEHATDDVTPNESYHGYSVDDEDQPQDTGDSLTDTRGLDEPLDEGYSPPEKWSPAQGWGNTPLEEEMGETLDQRLSQEVPEPDPYAEAEQDVVAPEHEGEVGDQRAGRLVEPDEGVHRDTEAELTADDVGIDGAGAGAEEAAVHVVDDQNG